MRAAYLSIRSATVGAAMAAVFCGGCVGPVTLHNSGISTAMPQSDEAAPVHAASTAPLSGCVLTLGEITDGRVQTGDMTDSWGMTIRHEDFLGWVRDGIMTLRARNISFAATDDPARTRVEVTVVKAYLQHLSSSMSANVVFKVRVTRPDAPPEERYARGRDTGMNWANGDGEVQSAFNLALTGAVDELYKELRPLCAAPAAVPLQAASGGS